MNKKQSILIIVLASLALTPDLGAVRPRLKVEPKMTARSFDSFDREDTAGTKLRRKYEAQFSAKQELERLLDKRKTQLTELEKDSKRAQQTAQVKELIETEEAALTELEAKVATTKTQLEAAQDGDFAQEVKTYYTTADEGDDAFAAPAGLAHHDRHLSPHPRRHDSGASCLERNKYQPFFLDGPRDGYGFRKLDEKPTAEKLAEMYNPTLSDSTPVYPKPLPSTLFIGSANEGVVDKVQIGKDKFVVVIKVNPPTNTEPETLSFRLEPFEDETPLATADTAAVKPFLGKQIPERFQSERLKNLHVLELDRTPETQEARATLHQRHGNMKKFKVKGQNGEFFLNWKYANPDDYSDDSGYYSFVPVEKCAPTHILESDPTDLSSLTPNLRYKVKTGDKTFKEIVVVQDERGQRSVVDYQAWRKEMDAKPLTVTSDDDSSSDSEEDDDDDDATSKSSSGSSSSKKMPAPLSFAAMPAQDALAQLDSELYPHGLPVTVGGKPHVVVRSLVAQRQRRAKTVPYLPASSEEDLKQVEPGFVFVLNGKAHQVALVEEEHDDTLNAMELTPGSTEGQDRLAHDRKPAKHFVKKAVPADIEVFDAVPTEAQIKEKGLKRGAVVLVKNPKKNSNNYVQFTIENSDEATIVPSQDFCYKVKPNPKSRWYHHTGKRMAAVNASTLVLASLVQVGLEGYVGTADKDTRTTKQKLRDAGKALISWRKHKENVLAVLSIFRKAAQKSDDTEKSTLKTRFKAAVNKKPVFVSAVCALAAYNVAEGLMHQKTRAFGRSIKSKLGF